MKRVAVIAFLVAMTLCGLALLWAFRVAAILFLVSIGVAAALRPMIELLRARGLSVKTSIAAAYTLCLVAVGILAYALTSRLVVELPIAVDRLIETYAAAATSWPHAGGFRQVLSGLLPATGTFQHAVGGMEPTAVAGQAVDTTLGVLDVVGQVLLVVVLSIYWTSGRDAFERLWLSFLPARRRQRAQAVWIAIRTNVGDHIRRDLVLSVLAALALTIGLRMAGCDLWALATLAFLVLRLIPLLGGAAAVLAVLLCAAGSGPVTAAIATVMAVVLLAALRFVVAPRALRVTRPLHPILAILVIVGFASQFGLVGLIAAPFAAVTIQTFFAELIAARVGEVDLPTMADLAARAARVEKRFRWTPPPPAVGSLLSRLQYLLERAAQR